MNIQTEVPMIVDWPATWSKILLFLTCHWKFWLQEGSKFVTGKADIPFSTNRAMQLGEAKHDLYEIAVKTIHMGLQVSNAVTNNPLWNPRIGEIIEALLSEYQCATTEKKIGLDSTWGAWSLGEYWNPNKVAFGSRKMLLRTKMDFVLLNNFDSPTHAVIVDWKSGKARKPGTLGQLALYALVAFCKWPTLGLVDCAYIFVDHDRKDVKRYYRTDLPALKNHFTSQILTIQQYLKDASTKIPTGDCTPGNCHWCAATKEQCDERT